MQTLEHVEQTSLASALSSSRDGLLPSRFWFTHAILPAIALAAVLLLFEEFRLDSLVAHLWAYDAHVGRWIGHGRWWADEVLHQDGRSLILLVIAGLLVTIGLSFVSPRFQAARPTALYLLVTIALAWGLVGLLKQVTNVACPWSLQGFGGERPYVPLFNARPVGYAHAACFPGAHSASGFALFAFYFAFRDRRPRRARIALAIAITVGVLFAFGQEARGAHFLSHDLCSALIVWFVALGPYTYRRRLSGKRQPLNARFEFKRPSPPPGAVPVPARSERAAEHDAEYR